MLSIMPLIIMNGENLQYYILCNITYRYDIYLHRIGHLDF